MVAMLLMDRNKMSNLNGGPSTDASYQVSVHLAKQFQRRFFLEIDQPELLITNRNEMSNIYKGPCTDASYQVSIHLAKRFQSPEKIKMLKVNKRHMPSEGKSSYCLWQGELMNRNNSFSGFSYLIKSLYFFVFYFLWLCNLFLYIFLLFC